jgi:hypothetical protein
MTNQQPNSQQCWQINLPIAKFPKSKFQFGDCVARHGQDDLGNHYSEIGEIIGMEYVVESDCPKGDRQSQWYYRLRFLKCNHQPALVGFYNYDYEPESCLVAD